MRARAVRSSEAERTFTTLNTRSACAQGSGRRASGCRRAGVSVGVGTVPGVSTTTTKRADRSARPGFRCAECGWTATKWVGRCGECQAWGTVSEDLGPGGGAPRTVAT
ncbi:hypothetical protein HGA02_13095, partial [Cellulomonas septica]|nr:hypothetical protein [Cellulomonas septica]